MKVYFINNWENKDILLLPTIEIDFKEKSIGIGWLFWGIVFEFND